MKILILHGEDANELHALLTSLTAEYQPETEMQQTLITNAARGAWELARINREFDKSQEKLYDANPDMHAWDAAAQSELDRMSRHRTAAQRSYDRALQRVEFLRKLRVQSEQRAFSESLHTERLSLSKQRLKLSTTRLKQSEAKTETQTGTVAKDQATRAITWPTAIVNLSQVIEVRVTDGVVSTRIHPRREDMHHAADRSQVGAQVLRRFEFPNGIPAEYAWVNEPDIYCRAGLIWEQRFPTVQAWRAHVAWEALAGNGHFLPTRKAI
jgi:hypothetical protein